MNKILVGLTCLLSVVVTAPATAGASAEHESAGPTVHITSPSRASIAPGEGIPGYGSFNGSGFALSIEAETHDTVGVRVKEALNIRHTAALGQANPDFPGLNVTIDNDLTKPDGGIIPAGTNLASLFNIAGTDDTPGPGVTVWAGWHVLESVAPGTKHITINVAVTDEAGRTGSTQQRFKVSDRAGISGQALTPTPGTVSTTNLEDTNGPGVSIKAPEAPTSIALGTLPQPTLANGTLFFLQVNATDNANHGIGVSENGTGNGLIVDPTQIGAHGPNRNYPGLNVTFDVGLRQPNGNLIPAGQNLAPLFNIAGSELVRGDRGKRENDDRHGHTVVRTVADWVIGGSLVLAPGQTEITINATVTDNAGYTGTKSITVGVSPSISGQNLTPNP